MTLVHNLMCVSVELRVWLWQHQLSMFIFPLALSSLSVCVCVSVSCHSGMCFIFYINDTCEGYGGISRVFCFLPSLTYYKGHTLVLSARVCCFPCSSLVVSYTLAIVSSIS
jgi:hypothetical protein